MSKKGRKDPGDKYLDEVGAGTARPLYEFPAGVEGGHPPTSPPDITEPLYAFAPGKEDTTAGIGPVQEWMWFLGEESFRIPGNGVSLKQVYSTAEEFTGKIDITLYAKVADCTEFGGLVEQASSDGWCQIPRTSQRLKHVCHTGIQLVAEDGRPGEVEEQGNQEEDVHKPREKPHQKKGKKPCRFFLAGNCKNGNDCRFMHPKGKGRDGAKWYGGYERQEESAAAAGYEKKWYGGG